jgi:3-methylfumaryl-CoA hydratase
MEGWIGRSRSIADEMTAPAARRLAALLDRAPPPLHPGAILPSHWAAILFDDAAPHSALGPDGHPAKGEFLPPIDLPRRMLAGRRIAYPGDLRIGDALTRTSAIAAITPKQGRSGRLVFVTVHHRVTGPRGLLLEEAQDIAYREAAPADTAPPAPTPAPTDAAWTRPFTPDPVALFRYSALTFNGHRIHYDADYARDAESYPGLVVNGGLTTLMLLEAALPLLPRRIAATEIRTHAPLFCDQAATLAGGVPEGDRVRLWAAGPEGRLILSITAELAP